MTMIASDQSRDRRIEEPTNLWIIHPAGRRMLPWFVGRGISANAVSVGGLVLGTLAALAYGRWDSWPFALIGLLLSIGWLIADGLDGMIARATGSASALGRALDGMCDHGVFTLIYVSLACSIGTAEGWILAIGAGVSHAVQSNFYESERSRFHRRRKLQQPPTPTGSRNPLVLLYDRVAGLLDRFAYRFDDALHRHDNPTQFANAYDERAVKPMRWMAFLSANARVYAIFLACLFASPKLFWWFELIPLNIVLITGILQLRLTEHRLVADLVRPSDVYSPSQQRT